MEAGDRGRFSVSLACRGQEDCFLMSRRIVSFLVSLMIAALAVPAMAGEAELPVVRVSVEGYGDIYAELYPETAPKTVANFLALADRGFYNNLTFHRIISGFMIQGGDPLGNGTGGSEETIHGEFSANGVDNPLTHTRGVLSMARSSDMDSASSQFFIMHQDAPHLDGQYAAFGRVLAGMPVVDAICRDTPVTDSNGTVNRADQPVMRQVVRASRQEAEAAAAREAENGRGGIYRDPILGFSFPVPEGWALQPSAGIALTFTREGDGAASIQMLTQDVWRTFGAAGQASLAAQGVTRDQLNTSYFGEGLKQAIRGTEGLDYSEAEYAGCLFYSGVSPDEANPVQIRIGVLGGRLLCLIGSNAAAAEAMDQMLSQLTVDAAED